MWRATAPGWSLVWASWWGWELENLCSFLVWNSSSKLFITGLSYGTKRHKVFSSPPCKTWWTSTSCLPLLPRGNSKFAISPKMKLGMKKVRKLMENVGKLWKKQLMETLRKMKDPGLDLCLWPLLLLGPPGNVVCMGSPVLWVPPL